jgi:hypothetical protein
MRMNKKMTPQQNFWLSINLHYRMAESHINPLRTPAGLGIRRLKCSGMIISIYLLQYHVRLSPSLLLVFGDLGHRCFGQQEDTCD